MITYNRHQGRDAIEDILNPLNGYRGQQAYKGKEVKNHMKQHRASLNKIAEKNHQKNVASELPPKEPWKMKQFSQVQSRVAQGISMQSQRDEIRPQVAQDSPHYGQRRLSARPATAQSRPSNYAFGRRTQSGTFGAQQQNSSRLQRQQSFSKPGTKKGPSGELNKQNLATLSQPQIIQNYYDKPSDENDQNTANIGTVIRANNVGMPPRTPNYGKTPKYIEKFKEEAKCKQDQRIEEEAAKRRPPGTKQLDEKERIETLEALNKNKNEVMKLLCQLPISLRTENLKKQKIELEQKLDEIERAIGMFSRKVVYVQMD